MTLYKYRAIVLGIVIFAAYGCSSDVRAIETIITDQAKALTDFPKTKDRESLLRPATEDYAGIQDGDDENPKEADKFISDLIERINLGEPIGISYQISNTNTHVSIIKAWTTYDFSFKFGRGGVPLEERKGKCTALFTRGINGWLLEHEHCSSQTTRELRQLQNLILGTYFRK
jgi:hypothetical protein